ncbi:hypothetical protein KFE25_007221 [Diacronema lutheri]|uniref:Uncharacterized protein n=1 Tax=Diacronema lutheri TaxID=2081491 RepID=A0A8J5XA40_DIALT|nr:hypothetical protein KFE25_007221 [Diacronema lutheri]
MLMLLPGFGFLDTLDVPDDMKMNDDYHVDEWTDGSGVYHKHVTEVITFGNLAGALDALDAPTDGFDDLEVIDASGAVPAGEGGVEARLPLVPPPLAKGLKLTRAPF